MPRSRPFVSVVIPTANRPSLVARAIRSVIQQTFQDLEIVVVMDGEDPQVRQALQHVDDPRLYVYALDQHRGPGAARNAGITHARAPWVALLDDDDEWLPRKLERQLTTTQVARVSNPIISCRLIARAVEKDFVWPRRLPARGERFCEYLFCRKSPFWGEGLVQTSTILTTKTLLQNVPFTDHLKRHQDLDWLLRANAQESVVTEFVPDSDPLVIWHIADTYDRISNTHDWQDSAAWIHKIRGIISPRAYAGFLLTWASFPPARQRQWEAFVPMLAQAFKHGRPRPIEILTYLAAWTLSSRTQRRFATLFHARQHKRRIKLNVLSP